MGGVGGVMLSETRFFFLNIKSLNVSKRLQKRNIEKNDKKVHIFSPTEIYGEKLRLVSSNGNISIPTSLILQIKFSLHLRQ